MSDTRLRATRPPGWIRRSLKTNETYFALRKKVHSMGLATVCESALCPNITECWCKGVLTVMILGDICTRSCRFCAVRTGKPGHVDADEPRRVAQLVGELGAAYVVITSVDRDDLPDGGAAHWAETIRLVKHAGIEVEALVPDFRGDSKAQDTVMQSEPSVFSHNIETVRALQHIARPQADYTQSLLLLRGSADHGLLTKSGFMVGLGETIIQIEETLGDLADSGTSLVAVGQYLQPRIDLLPVQKYWSPEEFSRIEDIGRGMGLSVLAGPMVRSSYRADELAHGALISP